MRRTQVMHLRSNGECLKHNGIIFFRPSKGSYDLSQNNWERKNIHIIHFASGFSFSVFWPNDKFPLSYVLIALLKRSNKTMSRSSRANSNAKGLPNVNDLPEKDSLIERVLTSLAKIPEEKLINYGHQLEDMIISCVFNYIDCLWV